MREQESDFIFPILFRNRNAATNLAEPTRSFGIKNKDARNAQLCCNFFS